MTSAVLVPVKAPGAGKQRLAAVLSEPVRVQLIETMLSQVLGAIFASPGVSQVRVLSPEPRALPERATLVLDGGRDLNAALEYARSALRRSGVSQLAVVFADLPLLTAQDVTALIQEARGGLAIAPDHAGTGTNALCLPADADFRFEFGPGSLARHLAQAEAAGLACHVVRRPGLAFDVDEPRDVEALTMRGDPRYAFLR
ncbi:MAG: 2-phospho-L-lactate guanylyltransferase [Proteobacteria bacterium]|nr:2-phospho-L-lactate guanylyltransferase [Pseudomonadota bacterium]